ncbi:MAG: Trm112 family protein [Novipirellula sp. JB048]
MIDPNLLAVLRCPLAGDSLQVAQTALVERVNAAIASGEIRDRQDQRVTEPIELGLITTTGDVIYPVRDGIVCMVVDDAIALPGAMRS